MRWVVGNWKMHTTPSEAKQLARQLWRLLKSACIGPEVGLRVVVCPPFTSLEAVRRVLARTRLEWGAQTCHEEVQGAYTGEISARMLSELGCTLVLVGHSERRRYAAETDERIAQKLFRVVEFGMHAVLCVGETWHERERGQTVTVLEQQLERGLAAVTQALWPQVLIAYEPVWAIGTGVTALPEQIAEAHTQIRQILHRLGAPESVPILYGGSVSAAAVSNIITQPEVHGVLVGGASLRSGEFNAIVRTVAAHRCS